MIFYFKVKIKVPTIAFEILYDLHSSLTLLFFVYSPQPHWRPCYSSDSWGMVPSQTLCKCYFPTEQSLDNHRAHQLNISKGLLQITKPSEAFLDHSFEYSTPFLVHFLLRDFSSPNTVHIYLVNFLNFSPEYVLQEGRVLAYLFL